MVHLGSNDAKIIWNHLKTRQNGIINDKYIQDLLSFITSKINDANKNCRKERNATDSLTPNIPQKQRCSGKTKSKKCSEIFPKTDCVTVLLASGFTGNFVTSRTSGDKTKSAAKYFRLEMFTSNRYSWSSIRDLICNRRSYISLIIKQDSLCIL